MPTSPPDFYTANMALLHQYHREAWQVVEDFKDGPAGNIILAPNGLPNLQVSIKKGVNVTLHNTADPQIDATALQQQIPEAPHGAAVLIGMGLGYTALALARQFPTLQYIIVFELNPGIFSQAMRVMDLSHLLSNPRLILSVGPNPDVAKTMTSAHDALYLEPCLILQHPPSFSLNYKGYHQIHTQVFEYAEKLHVEGFTAAQVGPFSFRNRFQNLSVMHHHRLLEHLSGTMTGIPAILVAAGPSLNDNIHQLSAAKDRALIFSVDTALPTLLNNRISPDFVTAIDPHTFTYEKIADTAPQTQEISLICTPTVNHHFAGTYPFANVFWSMAGELPIDQWLKKLMGAEQATEGAMTVAHLNLLAAMTMGCSPIIFVGQDLSFTGESTHATGTVLTYWGKKSEGKKKGYIWVDGVGGSQVRTLPSFYNMKKQFETIMAQSPGRYINATAKGISLANTEEMELQEAISRFCTAPQDTKKRLQGCHSIPLPSLPTLLSHLEGTKEWARTARIIVAKEAKLLQKSRARLANIPQAKKITHLADLPPAAQKIIAELNDCIKRCDKEFALWQIVEELTMPVLQESQRLLQAAAPLAGKPGKFLEWIHHMLDRTAILNKARTEALDIIGQQLSTLISHHTAEHDLSIQLQKKNDDAKALAALAKLHFEADNFILAQPLFEKSLRLEDGPTESFFFLGAIAARQSRHQQAEELFRLATLADPTQEKSIRAFREQMAEQYLTFAHNYKGNNEVYRKLLFKAARFCATHAPCNESINDLAVEDITFFQDALDFTTIPEETQSLFALWHKALRDTPYLKTILLPEQLLAMLHCIGSWLLRQSDPTEAIPLLEQAITLAPENPDCHILMTDALFAVGDLTGGIDHLNQAVNLDRTYASNWEDIGDDLQAASQHQDAITAFEHCFLAMPDHFEVLKKISVSYRELGQDEAAQEALQQYTKLKGDKP